MKPWAELLRRPTVAGLVAFAAAWLVLEIGHPPVPLHGDTHEDLLLARECLENGFCPTSGASTTFPGVLQGALWVNLLAVLRGASFSVAFIHSLTLAMAALGIAIVVGVLHRRGRAVAWAVGGIACLVLLIGGSLHVPWNPSLMPLPAALLFAIVIAHVEERRVWGALPLGLALGLTLETHPVAVLVAPGAIFVAGFGAPSRRTALVSVVVSTVLAVGLYAGMSPHAALSNANAIVEAFWLVVPILAFLLVAGLAVWARPQEHRHQIAAAALALPVLLALGFRAVAGDGPLGARYLTAGLFPLLFLIVESTRSLLTMRGVAIALPIAATVGLVVIAVRAPRPELSLPAVEAMATAFEEEGLALDDVLLRASGPKCRDVVAAFAAVGLPVEAPGDPSHEDLVFGVEMPSDRARGRWRTFDGGVVGELAPWVDRRHFQACAENDGPSCVERNLGDGIEALMGADPHMLQRLSEPSLHWTDPSLRRLEAHPVAYRFGVRIPPNAGARTISVPALRRCDGRFIAVEGISTSSELPSTTLALESGDDWREGHVVIEVGACESSVLELYPPCLSEVASDDEAVLQRLLDPS